MSFGGFDHDASPRPMSEINTTPLVDVMLVLLIIFMVTAPLMTQSINVNLPKTAGATAQTKTDAVNLAISASGSLTWNEAAIADDVLQQRLAELVAQQPQAELHLLADKVVPYERVAQVMSLVHNAGVSKMGFVLLSSGAPVASGASAATAEKRHGQ